VLEPYSIYLSLVAHKIKTHPTKQLQIHKKEKRKKAFFLTVRYVHSLVPRGLSLLAISTIKKIDRVADLSRSQQNTSRELVRPRSDVQAIQ
jgi:hypothetical protein